MKKTRFSPFRSVIYNSDPIDRLAVEIPENASTRLVQRLQGLARGYGSRLRTQDREKESCQA